MAFHDSPQVVSRNGWPSLITLSRTACTIHFFVPAAWQCAIMHCVVHVGSAENCAFKLSKTPTLTIMLSVVAYLGFKVEVISLASLDALEVNLPGQRQRRLAATTVAPASASFQALTRTAQRYDRIGTAQLPNTGGSRASVVEPFSVRVAQAHSNLRTRSFLNAFKIKSQMTGV